MSQVGGHHTDYEGGEDQPCEDGNNRFCQPLSLFNIYNLLQAALDQIPEDVAAVQGHRRQTVEKPGIEVDPTYPEQCVGYPEELAAQRCCPTGRHKEVPNPAAEPLEASGRQAPDAGKWHGQESCQKVLTPCPGSWPKPEMNCFAGNSWKVTPPS